MDRYVGGRYLGGNIVAGRETKADWLGSSNGASKTKHIYFQRAVHARQGHKTSGRDELELVWRSPKT